MSKLPAPASGRIAVALPLPHDPTFVMDLLRKGALKTRAIAKDAKEDLGGLGLFRL